MSNFTHEWAAQYLAQFKKPVSDIELEEKAKSADEGPEEKLRVRIVEYCEDHGFPCLFFPQTPAVKKFLPPGWPDGIIALTESRVVFMELKSKKGTLKTDQRKYKLMFLFLGHEWYLVRSYKRFLEIVNLKRGENGIPVK